MTDARPFVLEGRHALVAGVGGPLARPVAVALAEGGATVSLMTQAGDRAQEVEAQSILNECWSLGRDGQVCRVDSTDEAAVEAALDGIEAQLGPIAVCATVHQPVRRRSAVTINREAWDAEIAACATSIVVPLLAAGRRMVGRNEGRIVNVLSSAYEGMEPGTALFAASQGAILGFTRVVTSEWAPHNVIVRTLIAGALETASGPHAHAALRAAVRDPTMRSGDVEQVTGEARVWG